MNEEQEAFKRLFEGKNEDIEDSLKELESEHLTIRFSGLRGLGRSYRGRAVYSYMLNVDRNAFYKDMNKSISYLLELLKQHEILAEKDDSRLGAKHFESLLDCFVCCGFNTAKKIADYNRPYAYSELGNKIHHWQMLYLFCDVMVSSPEKQNELLPILDKYIERSKKHAKSYEGYGHAMKAIIQRDEEALKAAFDRILSDHQYLNRAMTFGYGPDRYIALWVLGLANLAIALGMHVDIDHKYLPKDLLADPKEAQKAWAQR